MGLSIDQVMTQAAAKGAELVLGFNPRGSLNLAKAEIVKGSHRASLVFDESVSRRIENVSIRADSFRGALNAIIG
jgi:hypothetical protein